MDEARWITANPGSCTNGQAAWAAEQGAPKHEDDGMTDHMSDADLEYIAALAAIDCRADAHAAIDAMLAKAREDAWREAIDVVHQECWSDGPMSETLMAEQSTTALAIAAIRALIDQTAKMQVKYGTYYRRRDGEKEGPMEYTPCGYPFYATHPWFFDGRTYCDNGTFSGRPDIETIYDLIEEWPDELPHGHACLPSGEVVDLSGKCEERHLMHAGGTIGCDDCEVKIRAPGALLWSVDLATWGIAVAESTGHRIIYRGSELTDGHARLPDGSVVDLAANTEAHGLMHPAKRAAMMAHGGPYVWLDSSYVWRKKGADDWFNHWVYRVAHGPREGWVAVLHPTRRAFKVAHPGIDPMFVREAKP